MRPASAIRLAVNTTAIYIVITGGGNANCPSQLTPESHAYNWRDKPTVLLLIGHAQVFAYSAIAGFMHRSVVNLFILFKLTSLVGWRQARDASTTRNVCTEFQFSGNFKYGQRCTLDKIIRQTMYRNRIEFVDIIYENRHRLCVQYARCQTRPIKIDVTLFTQE